MKTNLLSLALASSLFAVAAAHAATAPADAPAGSTAQCKDGSFYSGDTKKGACSGHKGIKTWYGAEPAKDDTKAEKKTKKEKAEEKKADAGAAPAAGAAAAPAAATAATTKSMPAPATTAAPGGGPGKVWANTSSKVYHCSGDKWYGKTKEGEYMSEADAKAKGFHADHGKACS